ncbi:sn-glycerol-3-phosphate ABC transporter ATP-binding protein UgpC [Candidatus Kapaibacterium sp.]
MTKIELKNIVKEYQEGVRAVDNFSIKADAGDFVVLVGPSGCGKSTVLRMIAGLEDITSGEIYFGEQLVNNLEPQQRNIGMVFQNYALYPHLSVFENLAFPLKIIKTNKKDIESRVKQISSITGLGELLHRKPKQLSGGQRQRVALARALIRQPAIFLFDEPLSNLDAKLRIQMRSDILDLHKTAGTTSVYVTHDQTEAMTMGTKIAVVDKGKLQQYGKPDEIYSKPQNLFVAGFLGSPQMNFIPLDLAEGELKNSFLSIPLSDLSLNQNAGISGSNLTGGIRPEHLNADVDSGIFRAEISRIEYLGHEQYIHCKINDTVICVRDNSPGKYTPGENIGITFDFKNMHLFDNTSLRIN